MINVKWIDDPILVRSTIVDKSVYPFVSDDTCPSPEEFPNPVIDDNFFCAGCYKDDEYIGCFCFSHKSIHEVEIHTCLLPSARGIAKDCGEMVVEFLFKQKPYLRITTFIPVINSLAKKLALRCGFKYLCDTEPTMIGGVSVINKKYVLLRANVCL